MMKHVYLDEIHHERAKVKASSQRRTLRAYIENLIDRDNNEK